MDALEKNLPEEWAEVYIACIAERLDGFERIQAIERLAATRNPDIKAWLLREGFRNSLDVNYLALTCAVTGDLIGALRQESIDSALLEGAGEILESLRLGGPSDWILAYEHAAEAILLWLDHLAKAQEASLRCAYYADNMRTFAHEYVLPGWTDETREEIARRADAALAAPIWRERVSSILSRPDHPLFWLALEVADIVGVDVWDIRYEQMLRHRKGSWFGLFRARTAEKLRLTVKLAEERSGIGISEPVQQDSPDVEAWSDETNALNQILHSLAIVPFWREEFFPLVEAGLVHPTGSVAAAALSALERLAPSIWPDTITAIIQKFAESAVTKNDQEQFAALLEGRSPEWDSSEEE